MQMIQQLRDEIDKIDEEIIKNLARRKELSMEIGKIKALSSQNVYDPEREKNQFLNYHHLCETYQLQFEFIKVLFELIISNSRTLQA